MTCNRWYEADGIYSRCEYSQQIGTTGLIRAHVEDHVAYNSDQLEPSIIRYNNERSY